VDDVVRVDPEVLDDIVAHARGAVPGECCGLLIGSRTHVSAAARTRNLSAHGTRYLVDPAAHFAAIRRARAAGLQVVGAYHSHPLTPARPSATDLEDALPDFLYLIVSLRPGEEHDDGARGRGLVRREAIVRAWRLADQDDAQSGAPASAGLDRDKMAGSWRNFMEVGLVAGHEEAAS
jgi:proteasome lid subunit RPN8/RPN11